MDYYGLARKWGTLSTQNTLDESCGDHVDSAWFCQTESEPCMQSAVRSLGQAYKHNSSNSRLKQLRENMYLLFLFV